MIVLDTSAIIAMYRDEAEADAILHCIIDAKAVAISAGTLIETSIVLKSDRFGHPSIGNDWLDALLVRESVLVEAVSIEQTVIARAAHSRYGRGSGHRAAMNFGDCFAYALAKSLGVPLLYKGNDFAQTDIVSALA